MFTWHIKTGICAFASIELTQLYFLAKMVMVYHAQACRRMVVVHFRCVPVCVSEWSLFFRFRYYHWANKRKRCNNNDIPMFSMTRIPLNKKNLSPNNVSRFGPTNVWMCICVHVCVCVCTCTTCIFFCLIMVWGFFVAGNFNFPTVR